MKRMDKSRVVMEEEGESEEFRLLKEYCRRRERRRSSPLGGYAVFQGPGPTPLSDRAGIFRQSAPAPTSLNTVVDCLTDIANSAPIAEGDLKTEDSSPEHQQDVVEKLVALLKKHGDDLNEKIKQNKVLHQQLQAAFSYSLFERVTAALQGPGTAPPGASKEEERLRREQIAWTFEVTRRLSAIDLIPKRRALSFGERFLRQHHSDWVQQHGGWDKVFSSEEID